MTLLSTWQSLPFRQSYQRLLFLLCWPSSAEMFLESTDSLPAIYPQKTTLTIILPRSMVGPKHILYIHDAISKKRCLRKASRQTLIGIELTGKLSETALLASSETQPERISPCPFSRSLYPLCLFLPADKSQLFRDVSASRALLTQRFYEGETEPSFWPPNFVLQ